MTDIAPAADLATRAEMVIPGGVNSGNRRIAGIERLVVVSAAGATFTDAEGNTYIDFHGAYGPAILGYNDPDVKRAVQDSMRSRDHVGVGVSPVEVELAEKLVGVVPSIERVLLMSTGSEATFHAVRVSRAFTGRQRIIKFQGCYHGWHDSVAMNVISAPDRVGSKDPLSAGVLPEVLDATIVLPFNDIAAIEAALEEYPDEVAAIILEPIPHNIGAVLPRAGYLARLRELCTRHGVILIFDEVITGFRHALGGYQELAGVVPDLTTLGKAMANGFPIAALGGRADLMDMFSTVAGRPVFFAGTYNGHPAGAAAALATINKLESEPVHEHICGLGDMARSELSKLFESLGIPVVVTGFGSVFVTYFQNGPIYDYGDLLRNDVDLFVGYRRAEMQHGVFELPLNLKRSHISYAHRERDIDRLVMATERAVKDILSIDL